MRHFGGEERELKELLVRNGRKDDVKRFVAWPNREGRGFVGQGRTEVAGALSTFFIYWKSAN